MRLGLGLGIDKRRVLSGGGGFTGLLDTYGGAAAAYSIRLLSSTYSGALVEIRRSSDNALKSFYHDSNNELSLSSEDGSSTTLSSWIGSDNGFVRTGFDPSGNGNNLINTTASRQPQIITSGALNTVNGKPAMLFSSSGIRNTTISLSSITDFTCFVVAKQNATGGSQTIIGATNGAFGGGDNYFLLRESGGAMNFIVNISGTTTTAPAIEGTSTDQRLYYLRFQGGNSIEIGVNGGSVNSVATTIANFSATSFEVGSILNALTQFLNGYVQEVIFYPSNQAANRAGIESNINDFYSIY